MENKINKANEISELKELLLKIQEHTIWTIDGRNDVTKIEDDLDLVGC